MAEIIDFDLQVGIISQRDLNVSIDMLFDLAITQTAEADQSIRQIYECELEVL